MPATLALGRTSSGPDRPESHLDEGPSPPAVRYSSPALSPYCSDQTEKMMRQLTVGEVMTTAVLTVRPTTPFIEVARVMAEHRISAAAGGGCR